MIELTLAGETVELHAGRAMHWPAQRMLLVADLHFNRADVLQRHGIPLPLASLDADLTRLSDLLRCTQANTLVVLGDVAHGHTQDGDVTLQRLLQWRAAHAELVVRLVPGNHDRSAQVVAQALDASWLGEQAVVGPFVLRHEPRLSDEGYVLAGHVHPAVRIPLPGRASVRQPCFHLGEHVGVLPAFAGFAGMHTVRVHEGDRVYAVDGRVVMQVPTSMLARGRSA